MNFNNLYIVYVNTNNFLDSPLIQKCFNSIKNTFNNAIFIELDKSYKHYHDWDHLNITEKLKALWMKYMYIKENPNKFIIAVELDIYIYNPEKLYKFIKNIYSDTESFCYLGDDAFIINRGKNLIVNNIIKTFESQRPGCLAEMARHKFGYTGYSIDYYNMFCHWGDLISSIQTFNLDSIMLSNDDTLVSADYKCLTVLKSSRYSGRYIYNKPPEFLCGPYIFIHEDIYYLLAEYLKQKISVKITNADITNTIRYENLAKYADMN